MGDNDNNEVRIFISHKHHDSEKANELAKILKERSGRLVCFVSDESINAGDDWNKAIKEELRHSHILILLYTRTSDEWDWCLYEAGLFTPLDEDEPKRVISIYSDDNEPPRPLKNLQAVCANEKELSSFIKKFFCTTELTDIEPPLNKNLDDQTTVEIAQKIEALFGPSQVDKYYASPHIVLHIPQLDNTENEKVPDESIVETNSMTLELFGLGHGRHTWKRLVDEFSNTGDISWVKSLDEAYCYAVRTKVKPIICDKFRGINGGRIFRPLLYRLDKTNDRPIIAYIALCEERAPEIIGGPIYNLLRFSTRFRYEVLQRFTGKLNKLCESQPKEEVLQQLLGSILVIENESEHHGLMNPGIVRGVFHTEKERKEIDQLFDTWGDIRGNLEIAIQACDLTTIEGLLKESVFLNRTFMVMISQRYQEEIMISAEDSLDSESPHLKWADPDAYSNLL